MKTFEQQLREAGVVAAATVIWTAAAVLTFDALPHRWFRETAAMFEPTTGRAVAVYLLPIALLILFVAGWMATLGMTFALLRWRIRDDRRAAGDASGDLPGRAAVQEPFDTLR